MLKSIIIVAVGVIILMIIMCRDEISDYIKEQEQLKKEALEELEKMKLKSQFQPGDLVRYINKRAYEQRCYKVITFEESRKKGYYVYEEDFVYCCYGKNNEYTTCMKPTEIRKLTKLEKFLYENGGN